ncbi:MAG TPA: hypothetical protein VMH39_13110, partial [Gemmatimonadaceae bacterium]|nr:hypothetical protein [Gemmatimonadaceae bacterium]
MAGLAAMPLTMLVCAASFTPLAPQSAGAIVSSSRITLATGWRIQSSAALGTAPHGAAGWGETISTPAFTTAGWYKATVPTTVVAALVAAKVYPDPDYGMNLRDIPGESYPIGRNFANLPMSGDSPFRVSWWFRTAFTVPESMRGKHIALHFDGINYRANVWMNGVRIATSDSVAGMFRLYEFDVTGTARAGTTNVLAVEVFPPEVSDLAMTWVDWNPAPPDKDMGIWRPVSVTANGPVALRFPQVRSRVDTATLARADLTITVETRNETAAPVHGVVRGRIGTVLVSRPVALAPHESQLVRLSADSFPQLSFVKPRLWWPAGLGPGTPNLYDLDLSFDIDGVISDRQAVRFGIRDITSETTPQGGRLFLVNGRRILIRGGGWAPDMLLRADPARQEEEIRYVRDLGLNAVRLEGKLEDEHFFDLTDRYGVLVLA